MQIFNQNLKYAQYSADQLRLSSAVVDEPDNYLKKVKKDVVFSSSILLHFDTNDICDAFSQLSKEKYYKPL